MTQMDSFLRFFRTLLLPVLLFGMGSAAFGQGINVEFGKNRVQYHDFTWSFYQSDNFVTYYYLGGQEIGQFVAQIAERDLPEIERMLDYKINSRMEILVYNDVTDLNMSNIGTGVEFNNIGGVTKILGNKIFVHFNGNHNDLRRQVREGMAKVLINHMIFGGNFQEVLQNAVLLSLPDWFVNGLVGYIGERWSAEHDNRMRDGILTGKYRKFNKLTGEDAQLAGHSFWYFIETKNGKEAIPNLLYLTRINRSLENGFLFVLGYSYSMAIEEWYKYFYNRYSLEQTQMEEIQDSLALPIRKWKNRKYSEASLSANGRYVSFVTHDLAKWRVHLYDREENKLKTLAKGGIKTHTLAIDYDYPLVEWDPTGRKLVVFYEKRDEIKLLEYSIEDKKKQERFVTKYQRILDFSFSDNPYEIYLSAINRGQSDIYLYNLQTRRSEQITNDFWDDLDPQYMDLGWYKGLVWSSNRQDPTLLKEDLDTVLPVDNYDLFFRYTTPAQSERVLNLTNTYNVNEFQADQVAEGHFGMLSEENGIYNRFAGYVDTIFSHYLHTVYYRDSVVNYRDIEILELVSERADVVDSFRSERIIKDTAYVFPLTDNSRGILEQDVDYRSNRSLDLFYHNGEYQFFINSVPDSPTVADAPILDNTTYRSKKISQRRVQKVEEMEQKEEEDKPDPGFIFQSEFETGDTVRTISDLEDEDEPVFRPSKVLPYRVKYSTEYVTTQLDNTIMVNQYQNFVGNGPIFQQPNLGALITLSISDLMEDYRFTGGFRIPTSFSGSEYFLRFDYLKKRLDQRLTYYRRADFTAYDLGWINDISARQITNYAEAQVKYPFDVARSLRGTLGYRNYRINFLSTDTFSLNLPAYQENWINGRLEYVFDNTYEVSLNILNGARYKFYYEFFKEFDLRLSPEFDFSLNEGTMHVLGTDIRHYLKIHRNIIWANRLAAATSFGSRKLIYYLGGVDNWLVPRFNNDLEVNFDNNYAFQTLATNMRGFPQNARNGNSYVVLNSELRIPVFSYLINTPIRSEIIRNFQLVAFGDIGTAWEGFSPFDQNNPFNSETIERGPVKITTQYFRNPIVGGYGLGARTVIFGYFVRADLAWGVDSGETSDPIWYFSLNLDF